MKTLLLSIWLFLFMPFLVTAQILQIHHVNVEDGDCTIIVIRDMNGNIVTKSIIDGGNSNAATYLVPYINQEFGGNANFDYLVLSHFHRDHYNGLLALANGTINANLIVDDGNYTLALGNHNQALDPPYAAFPPPRAPSVWETTISNYGNNVNNNARRPNNLTNFHVPNINLGNSIVLGVINGVNVTLTNIAANGYNIANVNNTLGFVDNTIQGRNNQNNFSMGWILQFGAFRYYTAGDIGGYSTNYNQQIPDGNGGYMTVAGNCAHYTDQETSITQGLQLIYPIAHPINSIANFSGHICAVKISHHGSACSNNMTWLATLRPTAFFTSAGRHGSWKLPKLNTLYNLSSTASLSNSFNINTGTFNQGFYFTNLYNFNNQPSLNYANWLFQARNATSYNYGNNDPNNVIKGSYLITVSPQNIGAVSSFSVWRVNCPFNFVYPQYVFLANYVCHQ